MNQEYLNMCIMGFIQETDRMLNTNVFNDVLLYGSKYTLIKENLTLEMNLPRKSGKTKWFIKNEDVFKNTVIVVNNSNALSYYRLHVSNLNKIIEYNKLKFYSGNTKIDYLFVDEVGVDKLFEMKNFIHSLSDNCRIISLLTR